MIHIQSRTHMSVYSTQMLQQLQRNSSRKADVGMYPVRASREGAEHSSHQGWFNAKYIFSRGKFCI